MHDPARQTVLAAGLAPHQLLFADCHAQADATNEDRTTGDAFQSRLSRDRPIQAVVESRHLPDLPCLQAPEDGNGDDCRSTSMIYFCGGRSIRPHFLLSPTLFDLFSPSPQHPPPQNAYFPLLGVFVVAIARAWEKRWYKRRCDNMCFATHANYLSATCLPPRRALRKMQRVIWRSIDVLFSFLCRS